MNLSVAFAVCHKHFDCNPNAQTHLSERRINQCFNVNQSVKSNTSFALLLCRFICCFSCLFFINLELLSMQKLCSALPILGASLHLLCSNFALLFSSTTSLRTHSFWRSFTHKSFAFADEKRTNRFQELSNTRKATKRMIFIHHKIQFILIIRGNETSISPNHEKLGKL